MASDSNDIMDRVEAALDSIRPYLATDGGDLQVLGITDDMIVEIELLGACGACPMSTMTMKAGVEQAVMSKVPEVRGVTATNITRSGDEGAVLPTNLQ